MGAGMIVLVIFLIILFLAAVGAMFFLQCALALSLPHATRPLPSPAARECDWA